MEQEQRFIDNWQYLNDKLVFGIVELATCKDKQQALAASHL